MTPSDAIAHVHAEIALAFQIKMAQLRAFEPMSEHMPECRIENGKAVCVSGCGCAECAAGKSVRVIDAASATDLVKAPSRPVGPTPEQRLKSERYRAELHAIATEPLPATNLSPAQRVKVRMEARRRAADRHRRPTEGAAQ